MALAPAAGYKATPASRFITELMGRYPPGFDLGLERIAALLTTLGDPHKKLPPIIHVAGTNGKGSTIAFMRAMLEASDLKVHVHTSPHLVSWHERFRIAGELVSDDMLLDALMRVSQAVETTHETIKGVTVFEIMTATAFLLFHENPADAVLLETGLGGEFDATNVIDQPALSVITPIALDHQGYLGDTLQEIAAAKAGIIKPNCPVIIAAQPDEVRGVLEQKAAHCHSPILVQDQDFSGFEENGRFVYQNLTGLSDLPLPNLLGRHQLANAALAIAAVQAARFNVSDEDIALGLQNVFWPGRMQRMPEGQLSNLGPDGAEIWLDGGHNPHAGTAIGEYMAGLKDRTERPLILIAGMLNTKEPIGYFSAFKELAQQVYTVEIKSSQAAVSPEELAETAKRAGLSAQASTSVEDVLMLLKDIWVSDHPPRILICGTLYLVGDVLAKNQTPPN